MRSQEEKIKHASLPIAMAKKSVISWILLGSSLFFGAINARAAQTIDQIVAIVNGEVITQAEINRTIAAMEAEYRAIYPDSPQLSQQVKREDIINQMIEEKLVLSEAKRNNIQIEEDALDKRLAQIKEGFPSEEEFELALEKQGLTLKELRDRFGDQEMMKRAVDNFVHRGIIIDLKEIEQYYETHQQEFMHPEKALVGSIFIKVDQPGSEAAALQKAKMVLERLRQGGNFGELVKEYSQGVTAEEGGSLGFVEKGQMIEEIDEAIFSLKPGEFTDVLKTQNGYRIFKVEKTLSPEPYTFAEAQDAIRQILYRQKFAEAFKNWINKLKQNAYIEIKNKD